MRTRRRGEELTVPAIGLGCMGMSTAYGERDDAEAERAVHRALELGANFFDTADVYGNGHNEELLGRALKDGRDQAIVSTKVGDLGPKAAPRTIDGRPEHVTRGCEASLERLGVETIDLLHLHRVDPETPIEESVGAMARLVEAGEVRFLGLSEAGSQTLRRAQAVHPIAALQSEWSLWSRDVEAEIVGACRELGIGFVAYAPLGRGFLTGAIPDLDALREVAGRHGATLAQAAIAWALSRGEDVATIPGAKKRGWVDENGAAAALMLDEADFEALETAFTPGAAQGARYPEKQMAALGT